MELRPNSILRISDDKTMELIHLYEKEQCLWNTALEDYKSRAKRHQAAERIAKVLNVKHFTSRYVIIKFKNLRNSYCQELKKMANSVATGDKPPYKPKVFWFKKMDSYLRPHLQQSRESNMKFTHEVTVKSEPNETREEFVQLSNPDDAFIDENNDSDTDEYDDDELVRKRSRNSSTTSKKPRTEDPGYDSTDLGRIMKDIFAHLQVMTSQKDDCFDSFGKYVSAMLRNMPFQRAMEIQPQIVNLLVVGAMAKSETIISEPLPDNDVC